MDALDLLLSRTSTPLLTEPAPTSEQLDVMLKSALRAPDHGCLRPYRFIRVEGQGLIQLGELCVEAAVAEEGELSDAKLTKLRNNPLRAPMILVAVANLQEHPKVPHNEQLITAGCAAHAVVQAAYALGIGAMWRSGDIAFNPTVARGLGLTEQERIIGFIYLGHVARGKPLPQVDNASILTDWPIA